MLFGRSIKFPTLQSREAAADRLSAAVLPTAAIASLKPVSVNAWIAQHRGKRFIGNFDGSRFKLVLLQTPGARFRFRNNVVIIVGSVDDHFFQARLRPPIFIPGFLAVFAVAVSAGLALSFVGPANMPVVQAVLALSLALPFAIVAWFFRREAADAEQALRNTVLGA